MTDTRAPVSRAMLPVLRIRRELSTLWRELSAAGWTHARYGTDVDAEHVWGSATGSHTISVQAGLPGRSRVEIATTTAVLVMAGVVTVDDVLALAELAGVIIRCAACGRWSPAACTVCADCELCEASRSPVSLRVAR